MLLVTFMLVAGAWAAPNTAAGQPGTLIWFGAHPDDEFYVSPLLGARCVDRGWACTLVVATHGEGGSCALVGGCSPDLGTVRAQEMANSAAIFGAELVLWDLGNGPAWQPYPGDVDSALDRWSGGDRGALLSRIEQTIRARKPDVVYTFDWRHGSYCHPEHRAIGALVATAIGRMGPAAPRLELVAGQVWENTFGWGFRQVVLRDEGVRRHDAARPLASIGGEAWLYLLETIDAHPSQFGSLTPEQRAFIRDSPAWFKGLYTVSVDDVVAGDPRYADLCHPSDFQAP